MNLSIRPSFGLLNPGDVVSAALRLYRDRGKTYFMLSAQAMLWLLLGIGGAGATVALLGVLFGRLGGDGFAVIGLLLGSVLALLPLLYGLARYFALSGMLGRLAFREVVNHPETAAAAQQAIAPQVGQFLLLLIQLILIYILAYFGTALAITLLSTLAGLLVGGLVGALTNTALGSLVGVSLGVMVGLVVFVVVLVRVVASLFLAEVVLAIEPRQTAGGSIRRSVDLAKTSIGRIQVAILAIFLVQLPLALLISTLPSLLLGLVPEAILALNLRQGIDIVLSLVGSVVVLPIWQVSKGILYYDLRRRREGLDLVPWDPTS